MMLTLRQLLNSTNAFKDKIFKNASRVSISFNNGNEAIKDARGYYLEVSGKAITQQPGKKPHRFQFRLYYEKRYIPPSYREPDAIYKGPDTPKPFTLDSLVWVSCTCEWFMYAGEVANAERDNSSILWSNGKGYQSHGPNPNGSPNLCKHLLAASKKGLLLKKEKPAPAKAKVELPDPKDRKKGFQRNNTRNQKNLK